MVRSKYKKVATSHKSDERALLDYYIKRDREIALDKAHKIYSQMLANQIHMVDL